jgi:hypothetical protein
MKNEGDRSIFAWGFDTVGSRISCFANSPADFAGCGDLEDFRTVGTHSGHVVITNKGLSIEMRIIQPTTGDYIGQLTGKILDRLVYLAIPLVRHRRKENVFYLPRINVPQPVSWFTFERVSPKPIYISESFPKLARWSTGIRLLRDFLTKFHVREVHPAN